MRGLMACKFYLFILAVGYTVSPRLHLVELFFRRSCFPRQKFIHSLIRHTEAPREISFLCVQPRSPPVENSIFDCVRHLYYFKKALSSSSSKTCAHIILKLEKNMLSYEMNIAARESNLIYFKSLITLAYILWFRNMYRRRSQKLCFNNLYLLVFFNSFFS